MASRDLDDLEQPVQDQARRLQSEANERGLDLLIYCTFRSVREQAKLFRKGRPYKEIKRKADALTEDYGREDLADLLINVGPQYGDIVTNAGPGQSIHNYGLAFDSVPMDGGKPVWGTTAPGDRELWEAYGELVRGVGLEWAGDWETFTEYPHAQDPGANWRELIRA